MADLWERTRSARGARRGSGRGGVRSKATTARIAAALAVVVAAVALVGAGPRGGEPASAGGAPLATSTTVTFNATGDVQYWTVPAGVTQATFAVYGAQGAKAAFDGALGGFASAPLALTPGQVVAIRVGGMGQTYSSSNCILLTQSGDQGQGGYNGGGDGGGGGCTSAGGGGASDVTITDTGQPVPNIVAGGGGGGAANLLCPLSGSGGGLNGGSANAGLCQAGGNGGNQDGTSGSGAQGQGSDGADSDGFSGPGAGGGGGYYGGSGGGVSYGGGGGSGYGPAGTVFANGVRAGDGLVTITYGDAPAVTALLPTSGTVGTQVQVVGHGFDPAPGGTTVTFGGVGATVQSCTATTCTVTVPPGSGTVAVRVTAFGEQSLDTPADDFTYLPAPSATSISPSSGPPGSTVTITGQGFVTSAGFTSIMFGNSSAQATCTSSTQCTAIVPGDVVGDVGVVVRTYGGETASLAFLILPSVTVVSPPGGPEAGATVVTITGSGFDTTAGGTSVAFGATPATAVGCSSTTTCTAVSPPGTGTVDVRVTANGGTSPIGPADTFTYRAAIGEEPTTTTTTTAAPTTSTTEVGTTSTQPVTTAVTPAFTG